MFKRLIFVFFVSVVCLCRADVTLRTSSGQEVYLTDSQFQMLSSFLSSIDQNLAYITWSGPLDSLLTVDSNLLEFLDSFYSTVTTDSFLSYLAVTNKSLYNLSYYSNIYSNQISCFLSAYTNNLAHQFSALPSQDWLYNYLENYQYSMNANYWKTWNEEEPDYFYNTSWERLINFARNQQFDYVYNSNYNPLWNEVESGMPYDIQELNRIYVENINLLNQWKYSGYERDYPLVFSNQLIKVNALKKLYEDRQAAYVNTYKSSLLQADNWKNGYVDYQGDFIPWGAVGMGQVPQAITDLISFNPFDMPLNDAFEFATNYLSRLSNPNDEVFGDLEKETKEVYLSKIQKEMSTLADCQTQKQLDNFINGLQDMLNTMSNCCANMSYLPGIYESLTNVIGVGDGNTGGSGNTGGDNSTNDYPLGFAPSETNQVSYFTDWQQTPFSFTAVTTQRTQIQQIQRQQEYETERQNAQIADIQTNVIKRVMPIVSRFGSYAQSLSRQSPPDSIQIIDVEPIQDFARYTADIDISFSSPVQARTRASSDTPGALSLSWSYYKILAPLHFFFNLFWLLVGAFVLVVSWMWLFRRLYSFRFFLLRVWFIIKDLFK